jgi:hypothetical protein
MSAQQIITVAIQMLIARTQLVLTHATVYKGSAEMDLIAMIGAQ